MTGSVVDEMESKGYASPDEFNDSEPGWISENDATGEALAQAEIDSSGSPQGRDEAQRQEGANSGVKAD